MLEGIWFECGSKEAPFKVRPEDCEKLISRDVYRACTHEDKAYHKSDKHEHLWGVPTGHSSGWVAKTPRAD